MTDRAKALADALREMRKPGTPSLPAMVKADEALAAYDAHPAEAATRENGDLREKIDLARRLIALRDGDRDEQNQSLLTCELTAEISDLLRLCDAALSTHQQQGAESELVKRFRAYAVGATLHCGCKAMNEMKAELLKAADALSRAPQPDTEPTEEMVWAAFDALHAGIAANDFTKDLAKRIVTAALSAKVK